MLQRKHKTCFSISKCAPSISSLSLFLLSYRIMSQSCQRLCQPSFISRWCQLVISEQLNLFWGLCTHRLWVSYIPLIAVNLVNCLFFVTHTELIAGIHHVDVTHKKIIKKYMVALGFYMFCSFTTHLCFYVFRRRGSYICFCDQN